MKFLIFFIIGIVVTLWFITWVVLSQEDAPFWLDRRACSYAYERELARLKEWRKEQLAQVTQLSEAKQFEAHLIIDYTMQIAASKMQSATWAMSPKECELFRMRSWPEGIDQIGVWINRAISFVLANMRWNNAAQADEAASTHLRSRVIWLSEKMS